MCLSNRSLIYQLILNDLTFIFVFDDSSQVFASYNPYKLNVKNPILLQHNDVIEIEGKILSIVRIPILSQNITYGKLTLAFSLNEHYEIIEKN